MRRPSLLAALVAALGPAFVLLALGCGGARRAEEPSAVRSTSEGGDMEYSEGAVPATPGSAGPSEGAAAADDDDDEDDDDGEDAQGEAKGGATPAPAPASGDTEVEVEVDER